MSVIREEALKEKKALEEAYEEGFDVIFNYGYGCCASAHNIYGSQPEVLDGMLDMSKPLSPEFFINPRCPLVTIPAEDVSIEIRPGEATNASERKAPVVVLETDNNKVGAHLSVAEVGLSNKLVFFA